MKCPQRFLSTICFTLPLTKFVKIFFFLLFNLDTKNIIHIEREKTKKELILSAFEQSKKEKLLGGRKKHKSKSFL